LLVAGHLEACPFSGSNIRWGQCMCLFLVKVALTGTRSIPFRYSLFMGEAPIAWLEECPAKRAGFIAAYPTIDAVSAWSVQAAVNGVCRIDDLNEWLGRHRLSMVLIDWPMRPARKDQPPCGLMPKHNVHNPFSNKCSSMTKFPTFLMNYVPGTAPADKINVITCISMGQLECL